MRIHRVYVTDLVEGQKRLAGREAQHLAQVLRVQVGSHVVAFDGKGFEAEGEVTQVDGLQVVLKLSTAQPSPVENPVDISLAVALLKGDKLTGVVRQATELGVKTVQLFYAQHSDVREISKNKLERLRRVAREAAKQSRRSVIPEVLDPVKLEHLSLSEFSLCAHPYAGSTLTQALSKRTLKNVILITGPEGGFSETEVEMLRDKGAHDVSLGPRILRAETAPVALLAAVTLWEGK